MPALPTAPGQAALPGGRGKGNYPVGPGEAYAEIQEAIDALIADQGAEPFTAPQKITVAAGVYAPFRIEPDSLTPTGTNRLIIEGDPQALPVISGRKNPSRSGVGALIGNNVPYVTVAGLMFRDLIKGAVFGVNSHRPVVNRCFFLDCGNVGVWFYQCDEGVLANSVLVNNDHGFVATRVKSFAALHNTFFNDTGFSRENKKSYCIFFELQDDRGQGVEDTGLASIYNNILYSRGDFGILLYEKDVLNVRSNYNNWFCPNVDGDLGGLAEIREKILDQVSRDYVPSLQVEDVSASEFSWRTRTGQDLASISDDPVFIKPSSDVESAKIDLDLLADSPVLNRGYVLTTELPDWFTDYTLVTFDFHKKPRKLGMVGPCTIGAHETNVREDWVGDKLFAEENSEFFDVDGTDVTSAPGESCDEDAFSFDRAAAAYAHSVPAWFPKVYGGRFYVRDAAYHLFVKKTGLYIRDMRRTAFSLPSRVVPTSVKVKVAGRDVTESTPWSVDGYVFVLYHSGLDFDYDETSDVEIEAEYRYWESSADAFATRWLKQRWKLNEGFTEHVFPTKPVQGCPIVVTDDLIEPGNELGLCQEFRTVFDQERDEVKLEFGGVKNLWPNSDFSYYDTQTGFPYDSLTGYRPRDHRVEAPTAYMASLPRFVTDDGIEMEPIRGRRAMLIGAGDSTNYIEQRVRIDPEKGYVLSAYGASLSTAPSSIKISLDFLDHERDVIASYGPFNAHLPGCSAPRLDWVRFGLGFYKEASEELGLRPFSDYALELHTGINMPPETDEVVMRFHPGTGLNPVVLDAVQLEAGFRPGLYTRIPNGTDMTVEYEGSDLKFHKVEDLTLQPVRNAHGRGFLSIVPIPARQWDPDAPPLATTLTDYGWAWGRVHLLPWAKLSGFGNKYTHTPTFSTRERLSPGEPVSITPALAMPSDIRIEPSTLIARQGSEGELFSVEVIDQYKNPYAFERLRASVIDPTGEFPGYLAEQQWGFFTKLGQQLVVRLDEAGTAVLRWVPPEPEEIEYRGAKPAISEMTVGDKTQRLGFVDVHYRVNPRNHGNPTLRDHLGDAVSLEGSLITGQLAGVFTEDQTVLQLPDFPIPGTVELFASRTGELAATRLLECFGDPIPSRQYRVDYEAGRIAVPGSWEYDFRVEYRRRLGFVEPSFPRRIYFHGEALDLLTGGIAVVQYDALVDLVLEALPPTGMVETAKTTFVRAGIVAQHRDREVGL